MQVSEFGEGPLPVPFEHGHALDAIQSTESQKEKHERVVLSGTTKKITRGKKMKRRKKTNGALIVSANTLATRTYSGN